MVGQYVTQGEIEVLFKIHKRGVIDRESCRVIMPEEFYNPGGPTSLYWEELAQVYEGHRERTMRACGGFDGLMKGLLDELVSEGKMSRDELQSGDYFFLNAGGITVNVPCEEPGPYGTQLEPITYFPRILADAEAYVANFYKDALNPVYVTQVKSVPNRPWEM